MHPSESIHSNHRLRKRSILNVLMAALVAFTSQSNSIACEPAQQLPLSIYCIEYATALKSIYLKTEGGAFSKTDLSTANVVAAGNVQVEDGAISLYGPPMKDEDHPLVSSARSGNIRQPLLVLVPGAPDKDPTYQSRIMDMDPAGFPNGSYMLANLSPHPVRFRFEGNTVEIAPDSERPFNPELRQGEITAVTIEYKIGEDWLAVSSSRWASRRDRRTLVCIYQNPENDRMLIKSIPLR